MVKLPAGGLLWRSSLSPQHRIDPSSRRPQAYSYPALTAVKLPAGGLLCPSSLSPQHRIDPSSRRPQLLSLPALIAFVWGIELPPQAAAMIAAAMAARAVSAAVRRVWVIFNSFGWRAAGLRSRSVGRWDVGLPVVIGAPALKLPVVADCAGVVTAGAGDRGAA